MSFRALAPDALAVLNEGLSLRYAELNHKAKRLARYLRFPVSP